MNESAGEKAIVTLVLGILGIFVCFGIGIVAIILGNQEIAAINAGRSSEAGRGLAKAGIICGWISIILQVGGAIIAALIWVAMMLLMGGMVALLAGA